MVSSIKDILNEIKLPKTDYEIEGDIDSCGSKDNYIRGTLKESQSKIEFYYPNPELSAEALFGQRVRLIGNIQFFGSKLQLRVKSLVMLGKSQEKINYEQLKKEFAIYENPQDDKIKPLYEPSKVALIAGENQAGYHDFIRSVKHYNINKIVKYLVPVFNAKNVAAMMRKAMSDNVDIICLVRGGEDNFSTLNDRELLQSVIDAKNSGIYIVTGLGHSTVDNLLLDKLANYVANTPTGAVEALNKCLSHWWYKNNQNTQNSQTPQKEKELQCKKSFNLFSPKKIITLLIVVGIAVWIYFKFTK